MLLTGNANAVYDLVHIIYDGPPDQQPSYAVLEEATAIEAYDGVENSINGVLENGYLPITVGDTVKILSPPSSGHTGNKESL